MLTNVPILNRDRNRLKAIGFQEINKVGWCHIQVNMFEVE